MSYSVKEADVVKDKDIMIRILQNNRSAEKLDYSKRYEWIYLNNPIGKAKAWIIWNDQKNEPVGFTGVFPREIFVDQEKYICWNCGDFSIEKRYRTLGVALKLRRAAKEAVDNGLVPFLYAHPNEKMEVIHLKVGHHKIARMMRFALPLRVNKTLKKFIPVKGLLPVLAAPLNFILRLKYSFRPFLGLNGRISDNVQISEDLEQLFFRMVEEFPVVGSRDRAYLQWKFAENPNFHYSRFDMFYKKTLVGTIFFLEKGNVVSIVDILIDDLRRFGEQLIRLFINSVFKNHAEIQTISFILQEYNPFITLLKKIGFKYRDDATSAVISYANPEIQPQLAFKVLEGKNWYMTVGDRDA